MMEPANVQALIEAKIPECRAIVADEAGDKEHFSADVISPAFEGLSRIQQHQLVYKALDGLVGGAIHALALRTWTPSRWASRA
jgi:stress-induced morphogen